GATDQCLQGSAHRHSPAIDKAAAASGVEHARGVQPARCAASAIGSGGNRRAPIVSKVGSSGTAWPFPDPPISDVSPERISSINSSAVTRCIQISNDHFSCPAKWQAAKWPGSCSTKGGGSLAQIGLAKGQRVRNRQPLGGEIELGGSPSSFR